MRWIGATIAALWVLVALVMVLVHASGPARSAPLCAPPDPGARPVVKLLPGELASLAALAWAENRSNGYCGMQAIAAVVVNRLRSNPKYFGATVTQVLNKPSAFSVFGKADPNRLKMAKLDETDGSYLAATLAAIAAVGGADPVGGADHFYSGSAPNWAPRMTVTARAHGHVFLRGGN